MCIKHSVSAFWVIFFLGITNVCAQYEFDAQLTNAYNQMALLKVDEGVQLLKEYNASGKRNGCSLLLENYSDFIRLAISEDENQYLSLSANEDKRLDELKKFNKKSPYYNYIKAEIIFQWALIKMKAGHEIDGSLSLIKAYNLLEENKKLYPDFIYQNRILGLFHIIMGNLPESYLGFLKAFGLVPDIQLGVLELNKAINTPHIFRTQALMLDCFLENFVLKTNNHLSQLEELVKREPDNLLNVYLYASILSKSSKGYEALGYLQNIKSSGAGLSFPYLHYLKGTLLLQKGDYSTSNSELKLFVKEFKGQNYLKDAYYKLSLAARLNGDSVLARNYCDTVIDIGKAQLECDKRALSLAPKHNNRNLKLIRAMLLFDGGYLEESKKVLEGIDNSEVETREEQTELLYRKARTYHELKMEAEAISFYKLAIAEQKEEKFYFAPNACLQLGYIYSKQDATKAKFYFNKAIEYKGHEYENSIEAKAKAGINKLNTRP